MTTYTCMYVPNHNGGMHHGNSWNIQFKHCIHVFCTFGADLYAQSRCLLTKFRYRSSVGRLSKVRCWLGKDSDAHRTRSEQCSSYFPLPPLLQFRQCLMRSSALLVRVVQHTTIPSQIELESLTRAMMNAGTRSTTHTVTILLGSKA